MPCLQRHGRLMCLVEPVKRSSPMLQFLKDIAARTGAQAAAPYVVPAAIAAVPKSESWINAFIPVKWQGRLAAALFALLWVAAFYIFRLWRRLPKRFLDDFEFITTLG